MPQPIIPRPLAEFFAAQNAGNVELLLTSFTEDAIVHDERQEHRGTAAIRAWLERTTREYHPQVELVAASEYGGSFSVDASVSGTFPQSPVRLRYTFTLIGDRVSRLDIG